MKRLRTNKLELRKKLDKYLRILNEEIENDNACSARFNDSDVKFKKILYENPIFPKEMIPEYEEKYEKAVSKITCGNMYEPPIKRGRPEMRV